MVLLPTAGSALDAVVVGHKLLHAVCEPLLLDGTSLKVSASIGVSMFDGLKEAPEELLRRSDTAMYDAKLAGRSRVRLL